MSKIKTIVNDMKADAVAASSNLALGAMVVGTLLGVAELPSDSSRRVVLNQQPVYAFAGQGTNVDNQLRRERDEVGQHYVSYAETQRTPSRSGKH